MKTWRDGRLRIGRITENRMRVERVEKREEVRTVENRGSCQRPKETDNNHIHANTNNFNQL